MGWFWASTPQINITSTTKASACPVKHTPTETPSCPVNHGKAQPSQEPATCPVNYGKKSTPIDDGSNILNPLNNMPMDISTAMAPGQKLKLSTDRVISSIPKGETSDQGLWEYPSPQQMFNAMTKKGKGEGIPEDAVESMVEIHNFLNEGAWLQILDWEDEHTKETKIEPRLLQFTGRPNDLSPRATMYLWLSKYFPETFNSQPPFDRHDWTVLRSNGKNNGWQKIRYVIDYYSAPDDDETGMPSFVLDTRPALDGFVNAKDRWTRWLGPLFRKAMGEMSEK